MQRLADEAVTFALTDMQVSQEASTLVTSLLQDNDLAVK